MMLDWTRYFWPYQFRGGEPLRSTWAGFIVCMRANKKCAFMIMLMWTFPCWPECSTKDVTDTNRSATPFCCLAVLCLVGLRRFHSRLIQNGKEITPPVFADSSATEWMLLWQICSCTLPALRSGMPRANDAPGALAKPFFFVACKRCPQQPVVFA